MSLIWIPFSSLLFFFLIISDCFVVFFFSFLFFFISGVYVSWVRSFFSFYPRFAVALFHCSILCTVLCLLVFFFRVYVPSHTLIESFVFFLHIVFCFSWAFSLWSRMSSLKAPHIIRQLKTKPLIFESHLWIGS